jgi:serine/threonine-protein kinase
MGVVYEATHAHIGQRAAIKLLHAHLAGDERSRQRFSNEARAISLVQHPGMVKIFDYGQTDDGMAYILMEFLEGEPLSQRLARLGQRFPVAAALSLGAQMAATLAAAHGRGIVHRDLKPENVFLVPDPVAPLGERAKLLDFGIAKFLTDAPGRQTTVGLILGTPTYMAPEQCEGREDLTDRVDVYALGVMLYELLAGEPPFVAETAASLMRQHMFKELPPLCRRQPDLPDHVVALVHDMLAKDPAARPSMSEVAARLSGNAPRRRPRRRVLLLAGGLLMLALAAGLLARATIPAARRPAPVAKQPAPVQPPVAAPPAQPPRTPETPAVGPPAPGKPAQARVRRSPRPVRPGVSPPPSSPQPQRRPEPRPDEDLILR